MHALNSIFLLRIIYGAEHANNITKSSALDFEIKENCEVLSSDLSKTVEQISTYLNENRISATEAQKRVVQVKKKLEEKGFSKEEILEIFHQVKNQKKEALQELPTQEATDSKRIISKLFSFKSSQYTHGYIPSYETVANGDFIVFLDKFGSTNPSSSNIYGDNSLTVCSIKHKNCRTIKYLEFLTRVTEMAIVGNRLQVIYDESNSRDFQKNRVSELTLDLDDFLQNGFNPIDQKSLKNYSGSNYKTLSALGATQINQGEVFFIPTIWTPTFISHNPEYNYRNMSIYRYIQKGEELKFTDYKFKIPVKVYSYYIDKKNYDDAFFSGVEIEKKSLKYYIYQLGLDKFSELTSGSNSGDYHINYFNKNESPFEHDSPITILKVSDDGKKIASVSENSEVIISSIKNRNFSGYTKVKTGISSIVDFVKWSNDKLIICYKSGEIVIYSDNLGKVVHRFNFYSYNIYREYAENSSLFDLSIQTENQIIKNIFYNETSNKLVIRLDSNIDGQPPLREKNYYIFNLDLLMNNI